MPISKSKSAHGLRAGYVVLATAISVFVLVGMLGLAVDLGRIYIAKSEVQAFADVEAIDAARFLNGKSSGFDAARAAVAASSNRYDFGTQAIPSTAITVEFSTNKAGPWESNPSSNPVGYGFVRVTARPSVSLLIMPTLNTATSINVTGQAVAAQVAQTFPKGGYLPFSPYALVSSDPAGNFGMTVGQEYAFLWPGNAKQQNVCLGNQVNWPAYNFSDNSKTNGSERGYFEFQSASDIDDAIMGLIQSSPLAVGDSLAMSNGRKQSTNKTLEDRAYLDTDQTNYQPNSSGVVPNYTGNGMRLVTMPINSGSNTSPPNRVLGFGAFLLPLTYPNGGNKTWCAIYMGSRVTGGASSAFQGAGSYVVRLVN